MVRRARVQTWLLLASFALASCADEPVEPRDTSDEPSNDDDSDSSNEEEVTTPTERDARAPEVKPRDAGRDASKEPAIDARAKPPLDSGKEPGDAGQSTEPNPRDAMAAAPADGGSEPAEPQTCTGTSTWKAGDTNASIMVGGVKRTYILHVPASYKGDTPVPLLLDFHPMIFGTAASQRRSSGYAEIADKEGFIVAYADGIDNAWNLGPCCTRSRDVDDFAFALAMVEKFKSEGCIDKKRVYAAGFSNGGGLSHYLGCKHADVFAAISPAAFDMITEVDCKPARPISMILFRGTADAIVPYAGGASTPPTPYPLDPIHFLGAVGTFEKWSKVNGCTGEPTTGSGGCKTYTQCKDGVEVTLCTAQGGGHVTGDAKVAWPVLKKFTLP